MPITNDMPENHSPEPRYYGCYRNGYYVVIDTHTGAVVPPDPGHYKRYRDGYLWSSAAAIAARDLNEKIVNVRDAQRGGTDA